MLPPLAQELIQTPWSSYQEAKERSARIDELLGLEISCIEGKLKENPRPGQDWSHLSAQAFQTPYPELAQICRHFRGEKPLRWLDLGAAYGRLAWVLSLLRPQDFFMGFEFVSERVSYASLKMRDANLRHAKLIHQDLTDPQWKIPDFEVAFLFDFSEPALIEKLLCRLRERASRDPICLIGRGRATRHLIESQHPWLSQVVTPVRTRHWSLYRSSEQSAGEQICD